MSPKGKAKDERRYINAAFSVELAEQIAKAAQAENRSSSNMLQKIVAEYFAAKKASK
jgi:hypothetical protein